ncbi:MAG: tetratricopeptide repeat protein [Saprospiraceae bacterium]
MPTKPLNTFDFLLLAFVLILSAFCYTPCLNAEFVNWDDPLYIYNNPTILNFQINDFSSWKNVLLDFNPTVTYAPLTSLSFALEKSIYGIEAPHLWHLDNVLLHLGVIVFIFLISKRLGLSVWATALVALLFGIHPMRVESVAWLTERKDVLYAIFYLWAILSYLKMKQSEPNIIRYLFILFVFLLSLMSKIQAVTLPIALILIDFVIEEKIGWKQIWDKIPFFLLALAFGLIGMLYTKGDLTQGADATFDLHNAIMWTSMTLWAYLYKLFVPIPLLAIYPFPSSFRWHEYIAIFIPIAGVIVLGYSLLNKHKMMFFGLAFFAINVLFTLPVIPLGQGYQADRFTYVAYFGLFLLISIGFKKWVDNNKNMQNLLLGILIPCIVFLIHTSYKQSGIWKNSETLWTHQIAHTPYQESVFLNRSAYYESIGEKKLAENDINSALISSPKLSKTFHLKGKHLLSYGLDSVRKAITYFNKAINIDPKKYEGYYVNRSVALGRDGRTKEALSDLDKALDINPMHTHALLNRAAIYYQLNEPEKSLDDIENYLLLVPDDQRVKDIRDQIRGGGKEGMRE